MAGEAKKTSGEASTPVIDQNVEAIMDLHAAEISRLSKHQRAVERMASVVGVPIFLYTVLAIIAFWIVVNEWMAIQGQKPVDAAPFPGLQTALTILALAMTSVVVITQRRQGRLVERNAHLDLQISLLIDHKVTKLIQLMEEMRKDSPNLPDRSDPEVDELTVSVDPIEVASRIEERIAANMADEGNGTSPENERVAP